MANEHELYSDYSLYLAAEECPEREFESLHVFHAHENRIIQALCAHGPVLVRGGRGGGKSALMIEAERRMKSPSSSVMGIYISLRHVPLLRSTGAEYEKLFCNLLSQGIVKAIESHGLDRSHFSDVADLGAMQYSLRELSSSLGKRLVLLFDDVAHIGREASLEEFFGIFRTISSSVVSCKASIYPGVTRFGVRFDVYNDATVFDLARDERSEGYAGFFHGVMKARFPELLDRISSTKSQSPVEVAHFLGRTVVGNLRAFVLACVRLSREKTANLPAVETVVKNLASEYYWPLLEELEPKLGVYEPLVETSRQLGEVLFRHAASQNRVPTVIVHREIVQSLGKTFEILEYAGFISKREASRAMRSGGRGPRYTLNLANLLEYVQPSRLTRDIFKEWLVPSPEQPTDIHVSSDIIEIVQPKPLAEGGEMAVLGLDIVRLVKSNIYPYGLTTAKIEILKAAGYTRVSDLATASDQDLMDVPDIGQKWLRRIRSVVDQAVWM